MSDSVSLSHSATASGKRTINVSTRINKEAAGDAEAFTKLSVAEQQAKLMVHLPAAIATLKAMALAIAPEIGLTDRIGWIEAWDGFVAGIEVVVDWGTGEVQAIAVGGTWVF